MNYQRDVNSRAAFESITASGILSARRLETYRGLFEHGPMTARELDSLLGRTGLWKRCSELEAVGLVRAVETRLCKVTGQAATVWDVTSAAAPKPVRKHTDKRTLWIALNSDGYGTAAFDKDMAQQYVNDCAPDPVEIASIEVPADFCVTPKPSGPRVPPAVNRFLAP